MEQWPVSAVTSDSDHSDPGEGGHQAVTSPLLSLTTLAKRAEREREQQWSDDQWQHQQSLGAEQDTQSVHEKST